MLISENGITEATQKVIDLFPDKTPIENFSSSDNSESASVERDDDLTLIRQQDESISIESDSNSIESDSNSASNSPILTAENKIISRPNTPISDSVNELSEASITDLTGSILSTEGDNI